MQLNAEISLLTSKDLVWFPLKDRKNPPVVQFKSNTLTFRQVFNFLGHESSNANKLVLIQPPLPNLHFLLIGLSVLLSKTEFMPLTEKIYTSPFPPTLIKASSVFTHLWGVSHGKPDFVGQYPGQLKAYVDAETGATLTRNQVRDLALRVGWALKWHEEI
ncbi:hypothetical protein E4T56_gene54, partial [Termitomyces sp. T112]